MEEDEAEQWGEVREYYPGGMVAIPVTHEEIDNFEFKGSYGRLAVMRFESALDLNGYSRAEAMRQRADQAQEHEFQERARERERYKEFDQAEGKVYVAVTAKLRLLPWRAPGSACHCDTHDDFSESHETHQIQGQQKEWQAEADAEEEWCALRSRTGHEALNQFEVGGIAGVIHHVDEPRVLIEQAEIAEVYL